MTRGRKAVTTTRNYFVNSQYQNPCVVRMKDRDYKSVQSAIQILDFATCDCLL